MAKDVQSDFFQSLYNSGKSIVGARGTKGGGLPYSPMTGGAPALDVKQSAAASPTTSPEAKKQQSSSSNFNPSQFLNQGAAAPTGAASAPGGSSLVTGGIGNATYAPSGFGLAGASQGLTYGGSALGASSGLIGSAGGATSGAATGGAGFGLGGSLVGGTGTVGGSTFAAGSGGAAAGGGAAGGGAATGLLSNPWTALAAAIAGTANYQHNKGISSWSDTLKGKAGGEMLDYYGGREDGKTHGFLGKIANQDKSVGKSLKGFTDLSEFDFKNALKNGTGAITDLFKGKII